MRLVNEAMAEDPGLSLNGAVVRIGPRVGVVPDTLREWMKQARIDSGLVPGTTTSDARRIKDLEREVKELKRANDVARAAGVGVGARRVRGWPGVGQSWPLSTGRAAGIHGRPPRTSRTCWRWSAG